MRVFVFLILISFYHFIVYGQGTITAKVIDADDRQPIEFATVTILNNHDSTLVVGSISDSSGNVFIDKVPFGSFLIKVSFIGYSAHYINNIDLNNTNSNLQMGEILLKKNGQLNEIVITTNASVFETKIDKRIFHVDENLTSTGGTGLDVLRQVPSITVDENENILLRGDANVTILIDGRPSSMPANMLLKQLPASAIDKVEIITNPSAKYDPEGVSGIINVVLKKSKSSGFNGTVDSSVGYSSFIKANSSVSLNYKSEHWNITSTNSIYYGRTWFGGELERSVMLPDSSWDILKSDDYGERKNASYSSRLGVDYFLNEMNTLYISVDYNYGTNYGSRLMNYNNYDKNLEILNTSQRNGNIYAPSHYVSMNTGWQKSFKNPDHTLFVDFNYSSVSFVGDEWLWHKYYDSVDVNYLTAYQHTLDGTRNKTLLGKIDYVLPISDSMIFEAGFHVTNRLADNDFLYEAAEEDQNYLVDSNITNHFIYNQLTLAPYFTFSRQFKKIGIKGGLRAEPTLTHSELTNTKEIYNLDYIQLFPSAHVSYNFNDYTLLQLSYSRRINRPELDQLNPFTNYSDNLTLETGNPFLNPEIIHVTELSFLKFWKKANINFTGYVRQINNLIRRELFFDGVFTHITNTNLGKSYLSGGDLLFTYMPIKGMRLMFNGNIWNTSTNDPYISSTYSHYIGFYTSLIASYRIKSGWNMQLWASYSPRTKVIQGVIRENYGGGISIQKSIFKDKMRLSVTVYDMLKSRWFGFESGDLGNYQMNSYRYWESRSVYFSLNYSFGKMVEGKQRRINHSTDISDDKDVPLSN